MTELHCAFCTRPPIPGFVTCDEHTSKELLAARVMYLEARKDQSTAEEMLETWPASTEACATRKSDSVRRTQAFRWVFADGSALVQVGACHYIGYPECWCPRGVERRCPIHTEPYLAPEEVPALRERAPAYTTLSWLTGGTKYEARNVQLRIPQRPPLYRPSARRGQPR